MKPCARQAKKHAYFLQNMAVGPVVAKIKGSAKKLGEQYRDATVVLYNKANLQPIAIQKPDENGEYVFWGLNADLKTFVVGFDNKQQFNAVIQDNVVPK